jgi:uncharacterized membrane protein
MPEGLIARLPIGPFASRPRLVGAMCAGAAVALALVVVPNSLRLSTRAIFAWDAGCGWFIVAGLLGMAGRQGRDIAERAARQDEGRGLILALVTAAAAASIGAVAGELSIAKTDHGLLKALRVALAFGTVAASWFVVQLIFALHYAHEYYTADEGMPAGQHRGGLGFPDDKAPDYWDFLHFAVIIGVAAQTADVSFQSKALRRIGTVQGVIAFTFNTVVLALTINLLAGLF